MIDSTTNEEAITIGISLKIEISSISKDPSPDSYNSPVPKLSTPESTALRTREKITLTLKPGIIEVEAALTRNKKTSISLSCQGPKPNPETKAQTR